MEAARTGTALAIMAVNIMPLASATKGHLGPAVITLGCGGLEGGVQRDESSTVDSL